MILLVGVLALSWRLNNDPTTRPPVSQNPLTPGMGFVDDDSDSEAEANTLFSPIDEEAALPNGSGKESPVLHHRPIRPTSWPHGPRTPTMQDNDILSATRLRRKGITESEEIWEELEDDTLTELSPFSQRRRSSVQTTPNLRPRSQGQVPGNAIDEEETPDESSPLLSRSGIGRSYRDKRRRRSAPMLETQTQDRERRRKSVESQEATGGWWKMKEWWYGSNSSRNGKGKGKGPDNGHGNGAANGA